jgi:hypothetical protein
VVAAKICVLLTGNACGRPLRSKMAGVAGVQAGARPAGVRVKMKIYPAEDETWALSVPSGEGGE